MIFFLAHHGADLIAESDYGTPMSVAVHWNRPESVQALAALGVPIDATGQPRIPRHFFVSFSQKNRRIAADLGKKLEERSVPVWIASDDLVPGTPDWEISVREAIEESFGVLLLASPDSQGSLYVRGELKVAETKAIKVIPLWIEGDKWVESIPLAMSYWQYIDFREPGRSESLSSLVPLLLSVIDEAIPPHFRVMPFWWVHRSNPRPGSAQTPSSTTNEVLARVKAPPGFVSIALTIKPELQQDGGIGAFFNVAKYGCVNKLLDDLYTNYLRGRFKPFSYGKEWILEEAAAPGLGDLSWHLGSRVRRILAPWSALARSARTSERDENWLLHTSLQDTGLEPGSLWSVTESVPKRIAGVAVKDKRIFRMLQKGGKEEFALWQDQILMTVPSSDLGDRLPFRYVIGLDEIDTPEDPHLVIIQTDHPISEDRLRYYDR